MSKNFDPLVWRADFPILKRKIHDKPLVYFDNAASSQKPQQVLEVMQNYYQEHHANVHRGAHTLSAEATDLYEKARERMAAFIGGNVESCIFTRNTTEAINLIAYSYAMPRLKQGDEIVISHAEHHANVVPWHFVTRQTGAVIRALELTPEGHLDLDHLQSLLKPQTKIVALSHMSNVLGCLNPIAEIAAMVHEVGAVLVVDGAQGAAHIKVDVKALGADFYALSGHKMCGPTGAGLLWGKAERLREMPPFLGGGEMIRKVSLEDSTYADIPMRFEAGTPNIAEAIGLAAAADYLDKVGLEAIYAHDHYLTDYALKQLRELEGISLYGPKTGRSGIIAFNIDGVHPHDVASALDIEGIAIRAGHHCAQPLMRYLGIQSSARASFYFYNTEAEVDYFVQELGKVRDFFIRS
ncbi:MAG: cysteine desulfurase [Deinococcales bacterium]